MNTRFSKLLFAHLGVFMFSFVCLSAGETRGCDLCGLEECWYIDDNQVMSADFPIDILNDAWNRAVPESNSWGRQPVSRLTENDGSASAEGLEAGWLDWISQREWLEGPVILGGIVVGNPADLPGGPKKSWSGISQRATWTGPMDAIIHTLIDIEDYLSRGGGNLKTDDDRSDHRLDR